MIEPSPLLQHSSRQYQERIPLAATAIDGALILVLLYGLSFIDDRWTGTYDIIGLLTVAIFYIFAALTNLYKDWLSQGVGLSLARVWTAWGFTLSALLGIAYGTKTSDIYGRAVMLTWAAITPVCLTVWHILLSKLGHSFLSNSRRQCRTVIVGHDPSGLSIANAIASTSWLNMKVEGFYDDREEMREKPDVVQDFPRLGDQVNLIEDAKVGKFDLVYINLPLNAPHVVRKLISQLSNTTVSVYYLLPQNLIFNLLQPQWHNIGGQHAVSVFESPFTGGQRRLKRVEDLLIGSAIVLLISLPMLLIALLVKLSSPGPVIFKQKRYGLAGKEFWMYKFRSMSVMEDGAEEFTQATKLDPRVTIIGKILRKYSLDELPQFINVLKGDMSIVGPRPHASSQNEDYRMKIMGYMLRHKVPPGITGLAQISGYRGETDTPGKMEKRIEYDLAYIRNWSLWLDIKIIFISVFKGFTSDNAY